MAKIKDLTGKIFGYLTVVKYHGHYRYGPVWECVCECGNTKNVARLHLNNGKITSCGCMSRNGERRLLGKRFNKLSVVKFSHKCDGHNYWECLCDCGNTKIIQSKDLTKIKSCGCLQGNYTPRLKGNNNPRWTGYGEISGNKFCSIERDAHRRNLDFEVSIEYIWEIFEKQGRKCIYSGLLLYFGNESLKLDTTASLDRIDSSKGYIEGNIQWVHKDVNIMKHAMSEDKFIDLCKKISDHSYNKYEG